MAIRSQPPEWIKLKAKRLLQLYREQLKIPRKSKKMAYLSFEVGPRWRLLSKDNGQNWSLLSHSEYNMVINGRR
ncbi:ParE family toxin-like protein [Enterobacter hormaechei]|uniref:ParE family toxin-like protein n=1 Tax=Enterobacter hormaechei TaxID=158836 RepID=UPI0007B37771|nr:hypothetical protein A3N47_09810 [Enterobacter hormaechei subsp. xiangfangensis]